MLVLLAAIVTRLTKRVLGLNTRYLAGDITREAYVSVGTAMVQEANAQAAALGFLSFRAQVEYELDEPVAIDPPVPPVDERKRLLTALDKILAEADAKEAETGEYPEEETWTRLERLLNNEPGQAMQDATGDLMQTYGTGDGALVSGWVRGLDNDPCELCVWWWREGRVWASDHPMPRHTGCQCRPIPVVNVRTSNYQSEKQAADRARERARGVNTKTEREKVEA